MLAIDMGNEQFRLFFRLFFRTLGNVLGNPS